MKEGAVPAVAAARWGHVLLCPAFALFLCLVFLSPYIPVSFIQQVFIGHLRQVPVVNGTCQVPPCWSLHAFQGRGTRNTQCLWLRIISQEMGAVTARRRVGGSGEAGHGGFL